MHPRSLQALSSLLCPVPLCQELETTGPRVRHSASGPAVLCASKLLGRSRGGGGGYFCEVPHRRIYSGKSIQRVYVYMCL